MIQAHDGLMTDRNGFEEEIKELDGENRIGVWDNCVTDNRGKDSEEWNRFNVVKGDDG